MVVPVVTTRPLVDASATGDFGRFFGIIENFNNLLNFAESAFAGSSDDEVELSECHPNLWNYRIQKPTSEQEVTKYSLMDSVYTVFPQLLPLWGRGNHNRDSFVKRMLENVGGCGSANARPTAANFNSKRHSGSAGSVFVWQLGKKNNRECATSISKLKR